MTDTTNFGSLLYVQTTSGSASSGSAIAELIKLEPPKIKHPKINTTKHGTVNTTATYIYSGVIEIDDFKATLSYSGSSVDTLLTNMTSGTTGYYKIAFPNSKNWYFSALVSEFQVEGADAQSPEILQASVTFSPTGPMIVA